MVVIQKQDAAPHEGPVYTLYYFPFSLYSILVRFAIELGYSMNPKSSPNVRLRLVNLYREENLSEEYLKVNQKGQVSKRCRELGKAEL